MKISRILIGSLLIAFSFSPSYGQTWTWGVQGFNNIKSNNIAGGIATDKNANAYLSGYYYNDIVFGSDTLTANGYNGFIVKYDSTGKMLWAEQPTILKSDLNTCFGGADVTDNGGNIYVMGQFTDSISFGSFKLVPTGNIFIVKYNPNGNVIWAKQDTRSITETEPSSIATDKMDDVIVAGYFKDSLTFGAYTVRSKNNANIFIVKFDSLGNVLWANSNQGNLLSQAMATSVCTDENDNSFVAGEFKDSLKFGIYNLYSAQQSVLFVKYDPLGNVIWAKQAFCSNNGAAGAGSCVSDNAGNLYMTGWFEDTIKFGGYTLTGTSARIFLVKYDNNGNVLWAKESSTGSWEGKSLSIDANNHIYMTASSSGGLDTLIFGSLTLNSDVFNSGAILKFDTAGNVYCGSIQNDFINPIYCVTDSTGNYIYMSGTFLDTLEFGVDTLRDIGGGGSPFIARWSPCNSIEGINSVKKPAPTISIYPNPNTGQFTLEVAGTESGLKNVEVYNVLGDKVFSGTLTSYQISNTINLGSQPNGVYFYRVFAENGNLLGEGKIVIQK